jgi:hypothetical protein
LIQVLEAHVLYFWMRFGGLVLNRDLLCITP